MIEIAQNQRYVTITDNLSLRYCPLAEGFETNSEEAERVSSRAAQTPRSVQYRTHSRF